MLTPHTFVLSPRAVVLSPHTVVLSLHPAVLTVLFPHPSLLQPVAPRLGHFVRSEGESSIELVEPIPYEFVA